MKKLVVLTALIVAVTAVAIGAASFQGLWMTADATKVSDRAIPGPMRLKIPRLSPCATSIFHRAWNQTWSAPEGPTGSISPAKSRESPV